MSRTRTTTVWPIMLALAILFGVSVTAPRSWEPFAHRRPLEPAKSMGGSLAQPEKLRESSKAWTAQAEGPVPRSPIAASAGPRIAAEFQPNVSRSTSTARPTPPFAAGRAPSLSAAPSLSGAASATGGPALSGGPAVSGRPSLSAVPTLSGGLVLSGSPAATQVGTVPVTAPQGATPYVSTPPVSTALQPTFPSLSGIPPQAVSVAPQAVVALPSPSSPEQPVSPAAVAPLPTAGVQAATPAVEVWSQPAGPTPAASFAVARSQAGYTPPTPSATAAPVAGFPRLNGAGPSRAQIAPSAAPVAQRPAAQTPVVQTPVVQSPIMQTPLVQTPAVPRVAPAPSSTASPVGRVATATPAPRVTSAQPPRAPAEPAGRTGAEPPAIVATRPRDPNLTSKTPSLGITQPAVRPTLEPRPAQTKPAEIARETPSWWPRPADLLQRLSKLENKSETKPWAKDAAEILGRLSQPTQPDHEELGEILTDLRSLLADARLLDESKLDTATAIEVRLARHAIQRRLDIWESLSQILTAPQSSSTEKRAESMKLCLVDIRQQTSEAGDVGRAWRNYLLLDSLDQASQSGDELQARALAREVLSRIRKADGSDERNHFLHEGAFAELDTHLRHLATDEIDGQSLLASIEKFEIGGLPGDGKELADECRRLQYSADEERRKLAVWMTSHYRNANIRVTLSSDILNRMMPEELRKNAPVRDTILGNFTQGWSTTRTGIGIRFLPSDDTLAVRFEAQGQIYAQTQTFSGPVRLFSHSNSTFTAHKDLSLALDGFHVSPAKAMSQSRSRLRGIRTEFDHLPILSNIIESIALDEHAALRGAAQREASVKISRQVERGLDAEIDAHLTTADGKLNERVIAPLAEAKLSPEIIELQSNEQRAIVRMRIAGEDQLAAYTPRPRAYNDNVGSIQIHQSAINNLLERSQLAGRKFTAHELVRHFITQFRLPDDVDLSKIPTDAEVTFADVDPITVRFDAGTIELRLAIAELRSGNRVWRDFVARTPFKPKVVDGETCLCRDGLIRISGATLGTTGQISLRTAFAKIFPDDTQIDLWPAELKADPRFGDLTIAQVDLRDGWLGVAVGPQRHYPQATLPPPRRR